MAGQQLKQLTEEHVGPATWRKVVAVLLGTGAMVLLLNGIARYLLDRYTHNLGYWLTTQKWEMLLRLEKPASWLVLGDSTCNQAVRPDIFAENMGGAAPVNLCTVAHMLVLEDAWMLQMHLDRVGKPDNVIIIHAYDAWRRGALEGNELPAALARVPLPYRYWTRLPPKVTLSVEQERAFVAYEYFPLYSEHKTLAAWILDPRTFDERGFTLDDSGYMAAEHAQPARVTRDAGAHARALRKGRPGRISHINMRALEHIRDLADQHGFDVYLAGAPLFIQVKHRPSFARHYAPLQLALERYAATSERVHYVLRSPPAFTARRLVNVDHLTHIGAATYTRRLVAAINKVRTSQ